MKHKENKLSLFALTWPIFVEMLLGMLMGNIDTFMLSHYSDQAVASVGVANQILFFINLMFNVVSAGTSIIIAQNLGAGREKTATEVASVAIVLNMVFGVMVSGLLLFGGKFIFQLMNIPEELAPQASTYLLITGGFVFLEAVRLTMSTIIRSYGLTRLTMYVALGINVIHLGGNYVVLYGTFDYPFTGISGVAISTVFSRLIGLVLLLILLRVKTDFNWKLNKLRFATIKTHASALLKIGIPTAGESFFSTLAQICITSFIALLGTQALSAKIYAQNIGMFNNLFTISLALATEILIGRFIGAKLFDDAYKKGKRYLRSAVILSAGSALLIALCSRFLIGLFTDNEVIINQAVHLLWLAVLLESGRSGNLILINALRAAGDVKVPVYISVSSVWIISVSLSYVLGVYFGLGMVGVYVAFICDEWIKTLLLRNRWRSRRWEQIDLIGREAVRGQIPF
ncbi:MATE family efflux transporter [Paenibacillus segetis]|uniref:Transporter YisQ n=1 Tax=Paenibacillus segetis TaxID=1325360 RepID=A0ABQ1YUH3_9BACL|nr:MATE family efflux transporter [Paenibacillus segetis]GGH37497.1 putative transporter YisQ [Paenibacillus segetis]